MLGRGGQCFNVQQNEFCNLLLTILIKNVLPKDFVNNLMHVDLYL